MPRIALPLSHLLQAPSPQRSALCAAVDVLEFKQPVVPILLPDMPAVFHWHHGGVTDLFHREFESHDIGGFLARIRAEAFSFDLGPACRAHDSVMPGAPILDREGIIGRLEQALARVRARYAGPVFLENYGFYPTGMYEHICDPDFMAEVLERLDARLLLDLGHAAVTADNLGLDREAYLARLPLARVAEIHMSRPLSGPPLTTDAHQPPGDEEYAELRFVLSRHPDPGPVLVAVEYYRELPGMLDAYDRLAGFLSRGPVKRHAGGFADPVERLAAKNSFDAHLVMGGAAFHRATGRDRHAGGVDRPWIDPATGSLVPSMTRDRACPVCGGRFADPLFVKDGFPHGRCPGCGLIYVSPVLTDEPAAAHYEAESSWVRVLDSGPQVELDRLKYQYGLRAAAPYLAGTAALDVGAGTGVFAQVAREAGFAVTAVELNRQGAERMRAAGLAVVDRPLAQAGLAPGSFDLVTLWEVLEHLADPRAVLAETFSLLKDDGLLLILVPNADSLATRLLHAGSGTFGGHSHVNHFNVNNLARLLRSLDYAVLEAETILTEIGTIRNHLHFEDPYLGQAPVLLPCLTPEAIHRFMLGSKLLLMAAKRRQP